MYWPPRRSFAETRLPACDAAMTQSQVFSWLTGRGDGEAGDAGDAGEVEVAVAVEVGDEDCVELVAWVLVDPVASFSSSPSLSVRNGKGKMQTTGVTTSSTGRIGSQMTGVTVSSSLGRIGSQMTGVTSPSTDGRIGSQITAVAKPLSGDSFALMTLKNRANLFIYSSQHLPRLTSTHRAETTRKDTCTSIIFASTILIEGRIVLPFYL